MVILEDLKKARLKKLFNPRRLKVVNEEFANKETETATETEKVTATEPEKENDDAAVATSTGGEV